MLCSVQLGRRAKGFYNLRLAVPATYSEERKRLLHIPRRKGRSAEDQTRHQADFGDADQRRSLTASQIFPRRKKNMDSKNHR
jgi:hypothetical protein